MLRIAEDIEELVFEGGSTLKWGECFDPKTVAIIGPLVDQTYEAIEEAIGKPLDTWPEVIEAMSPEDISRDMMVGGGHGSMDSDTGQLKINPHMNPRNIYVNFIHENIHWADPELQEEKVDELTDEVFKKITGRAMDDPSDDLNFQYSSVDMGFFQISSYDREASHTGVDPFSDTFRPTLGDVWPESESEESAPVTERSPKSGPTLKWGEMKDLSSEIQAMSSSLNKLMDSEDYRDLSVFLSEAELLSSNSRELLLALKSLQTSRAASWLRQIAVDIDKSNQPQKQLVIEDLKKVLVSIGLPRKAAKNEYLFRMKYQEPLVGEYTVSSSLTEEEFSTVKEVLNWLNDKGGTESGGTLGKWSVGSMINGTIKRRCKLYDVSIKADENTEDTPSLLQKIVLQSRYNETETPGEFYGSSHPLLDKFLI